MAAVRIVGAGRAGGSLAGALVGAGWVVDGPLDRAALAARAGIDGGVAGGPIDGAVPDAVVLAVPDRAVAEAARALPTDDRVAVVHLAGSLGLDVLAPHRRRAAVHPLVTLPDATRGAARLQGAWCAIAGDPVAGSIVAALGGRAFTVADDDRAAYHAAASIAANHLVALAGQVERVARAVGAPATAFWALAAGALDDVVALGPARALTGPVARADWATVSRHLDALAGLAAGDGPVGDDDRAAYVALARLAHRLAHPADPPPPVLAAGPPPPGAS